MRTDKMEPIHPGEVLLEEFIKPLGISQTQVAHGTRMTTARIGKLVHKRTRVDAETALRLARYFGTTPQFWMGLQVDYDLDVSSDAVGDVIKNEVEVLN